MENKIFRKKTLEKVSAPNQLNDAIKIIKPSAWFILIGILLTIVAMSIWAFASNVPNLTEITSIAYPQNDEIALFSYVNYDVSKTLEKGMEVHISPSYAPVEEYGFIYGVVEEIGSEPVTDEYLIDFYKNNTYYKEFIPKGVCVEIKISLVKDNGVLKQSYNNGKKITIEKGATCKSSVIIGYKKPFEFIYN